MYFVPVIKTLFCSGDQNPWKILAKEFIFNKVPAFNFVYHTLTGIQFNYK